MELAVDGGGDGSACGLFGAIGPEGGGGEAVDWRIAAAERLPAVAMVLPPVEVNWMAPADAFAPSGVRPRFL